MNKTADKIRCGANIVVCAVIIFGLLIAGIVIRDKDISAAERRKLAQLPAFHMEQVVGNSSASFMDDFEKYAADQFPFRESFRSAQAMFARKVLGRKEVNDLYAADGYLAKLEYEIHEDSMNWTLNRLNFLNDQYLADSRVYFSIIPDKNYYLAKQNGYPYLDFEQMTKRLRTGTDGYAQYIDLSGVLTLDNYYYTDTHWRQETLPDVAVYLLQSMQSEKNEDSVGSIDENYEIKTLDREFAGVYYGQAALPFHKDQLSYLTNDAIDNFAVTCYDSGHPQDISVYDMEGAHGMDPYEIYLSGSKALLTIDNPESDNEKELILFRDSFGSSIAPLLAEGYKKVTLVDIRYINPGLLGNYIDFSGADVLFLYSAQVLNNSVGQFIK